MKLNTSNILRSLRKRLKQTRINPNFGESFSYHRTVKKLIKSADQINPTSDNLHFATSKKSGIIAKINNKILYKIFWVVKNTVSPIIDTQHRLNRVVTEILSLNRQNEKKIDKSIKSLRKDIESIVDAGVNSKEVNLYDYIDYHGFEDENRGEEEKLLQKQQMYIKYFEGKKNVLDVGCGRGEFLTLLNERGISCKGLELSSDFVNHCKKKGLNVEPVHAIEYLKSIPDNTLGGIIALQVIEHMTPEYLTHFVRLAYDKMKPDSHIILETINPQSLIVFAASYYKDVTHEQPVHPAVAKFLLKSVGFEECFIEYSGFIKDKDKLTLLPDSEENKITNKNNQLLNNLLFGPQDYAVIGKKK